MKKTSRTLEAKSRLAGLIEEERRKIGEVSLECLTSLEVIKSMEEIEQMINEYTSLTYVGKKPARHAGRKTTGKDRPPTEELE